MYLSWILYVLNIILILVTDPYYKLDTNIRNYRVFISKAGKAVKLVFQQLSICHYVVM